jgi:rhamnogalacturonyl hydrolase YesR
VDGSGQWCNGQAGIGGFLIRAWEATGEERYADMAVRCAAAVMSHAWRLEIGACCGLSGAGHFLLDVAELTGEARFRVDAEHLASILQAKSHIADGLPIPGHRDSGFDYQAGIAGTLDFLIRLRRGGPNPWAPALRPPVAPKVRDETP